MPLATSKIGGYFRPQRGHLSRPVGQSAQVKRPGERVIGRAMRRRSFLLFEYACDKWELFILCLQTLIELTSGPYDDVDDNEDDAGQVFSEVPGILNPFVI